MPIKINVHVWRFYLDRLLTRCNLDTRGINLHSSKCLVCDGDIETAQHLFIDCLMLIASGLWRMVIKWWKLANHPQDLHSLLSWSDTVNLINTVKTCFDVVVYTTTWIIWKYWNYICFDSKPLQKDTFGDVSKSSHMLGSCIGTRTLNQISLYWLMILFLLVKTICNFLASC